MECSAMSTKYLGEKFDIHGGGMDLIFPHHEAEIAQSTAALGHESVQYWMHNNMITINGQKMGKSLGNFITLNELFSGNHKLLDKAYNPMTIRFFILQAHYRGTVDFSNEALQAAEKGYARLMNGIEAINKIKTSDKSSVDIDTLSKKCYDAINDDFNTPIVIATLFDGVKIINSIVAGSNTITKDDFEKLKKLFYDFSFEILGLKQTKSSSDTESNLTEELINLLLNTRLEVKANKDWVTADKIRDKLAELGIIIKDTKDGFEWEYKS
jgi:cysteinyl-tRNA synthetase